MTEVPHRGEVWIVTLGAGRTGEPGKTRPAVVVSSDELVIGAPDELIVIIPVSTSMAPSALRIDLPSTVGVDRASRAICRAVRAVTRSRLVSRVGAVDEATMQRIDSALATLLELDAQPGTLG